MPPIWLYAWSSSDGVTLEMDSIFYSTFCSNLFECMNNEESRAAVYWTLYLWAQCIRKYNSWMIEKPIKVVIKLQMSPLPLFFCLSIWAAEHIALTNCVRAFGEHIHSNMIQNTFPNPIPPCRVSETLGEIHLFQLRRERTRIPLSLEGEVGFKDRSHPQISACIKMYWCHWILKENLPD